MNNEITIMELFSGIGGFSKGFEDAGFKITLKPTRTLTLKKYYAKSV